jgi:hypothetical protein
MMTEQISYANHAIELVRLVTVEQVMIVWHVKVVALFLRNNASAILVLYFI